MVPKSLLLSSLLLSLPRYQDKASSDSNESSTPKSRASLRRSCPESRRRASWRGEHRYKLGGQCSGFKVRDRGLIAIFLQMMMMMMMTAMTTGTAKEGRNKELKNRPLSPPSLRCPNIDVVDSWRHKFLLRSPSLLPQILTSSLSIGVSGGVRVYGLLFTAPVQLASKY